MMPEHQFDKQDSGQILVYLYIFNFSQYQSPNWYSQIE